MKFFKRLGFLLIFIGIVLLVVMPWMGEYSTGTNWIDWVVPIGFILVGTFTWWKNRGYIR